MDAQQIKIYQRILEFSLDEPDAIFPFSQRFARENGWTTQETQRVIDEYKKFIFLAIAADHAVTPSDAVDRWHLHLTYTHSYWDEFCARVLQQPLHHRPTYGGLSEQEKFYRCYNETLSSYEKFFAQAPPIDVWAPPHIRFGPDIQVIRVNSHRYWILPKPSFSLPRLPSISLLRLPLVKFMAIALLSCISVLVISSFAFLFVENVTQPTRLSSETVLSQAVNNSSTPRGIPSATPDNNNPSSPRNTTTVTSDTTSESNIPTSEKVPWWSWLWLPLLFLISGLFGDRNNGSGGGSNSGDSGSNGCFGCACV